MAVKKSPKKLKTWSQLKQERFKKSPDEAIEYLKVSLEENSDKPELVIEAIKSVSQGLGLSIEQIAKKESNMTFPSEKELKIVRKKLSRTQGSLVLSKDATPLEKLRYEICRQFVIYQRENNLKSKELAKIVGVDTSIMSKVLKYRNERFSTDKLMEMLSKIYPKHDLLLNIV